MRTRLSKRFMLPIWTRRGKKVELTHKQCKFFAAFSWKESWIFFQLGKFSHDEAIPKTIDRNIAKLHQLVCSFTINSLLFISQRPSVKTTIIFLILTVFREFFQRTQTIDNRNLGIWGIFNLFQKLSKTHWIALTMFFEIYHIDWHEKYMI